MTEFLQAMVAVVTMLGGLCAFMYWMFDLMEKRLEVKLDNVDKRLDNMDKRISSALHHMDAQNERIDYMYKFIFEYVDKKESKRNGKKNASSST